MLNGRQGWKGKGESLAALYKEAILAGRGINDLAVFSLYGFLQAGLEDYK
jgi:hypothetical protein